MYVRFFVNAGEDIARRGSHKLLSVEEEEGGEEEELLPSVSTSPSSAEEEEGIANKASEGIVGGAGAVFSLD